MAYYVAERPEGDGFVEVTSGVMCPKPVRTRNLDYAAAVANAREGGRVVRVAGRKRVVLGRDAAGRWVDEGAA